MVDGTMRGLPVPDPGTPDIRPAARYLQWLRRVNAVTVLAGVAMAIVWMVAQALMPAAIGKAIDAGIVHHDTTALALWAGALLGLGLIQAAAGIMRHRMAVYNWLSSSYRTIQLTVRQAGRLGGTLPKRVATGEVVSIGPSDI